MLDPETQPSEGDEQQQAQRIASQGPATGDRQIGI
jgi:hypothetical protein